MGRIVVASGGGIAPWKTATICLSIFLGPCALALLWFCLKILFGIQKTLYQAVVDALGGDTASETFKSEWHRIRNDPAAIIATLFGDEDGGFRGFDTCVKADIISKPDNRTVREAWDKLYRDDKWVLATIYFETSKMAERMFRQRFARGTHPNRASLPTNVDEAWQVFKRDAKARMMLLAAY